ncbi:hypothetical protein OG401_41305 [Kitasatospora purpeofusca]|uniref:hypothetical protein n=1 Tax=Kitasatospora purpeofusca TaxID=67352 RepID=UPI0022586B46|nr:hypothetical protein [Kitasatospora purpeofusca]MCX4690659.1 hypothetical protein [Kitasatospora purpeofusca]
MSDHSGRPARRPLWQPFSESATDEPAAAVGPRLLVVERAPFLEPAGDVPVQQPAAGRRRLGHGALADPTGDDRA